MEAQKSMRNFFTCFIIGFVISAISSNFNGLNDIDIAKKIFITFMNNIVFGIGTGLAGLFSVEIYHKFKKKIENENFA